jgi:hypothetical protein
MSTEGETIQVSVLPYKCSIYPPLVTYPAPVKYFSHMLNGLGRWPCWPVRFAVRRQPLCWNFIYHSQIQSVGGSVWYMVQNLCCTITTDSVLANSKTQNAFLFPVHAMFHHNCPLAVKLASMPWCLVHKKTWRDSLPTDMLLSAVAVLVVAQLSPEFLEGLRNYPVYRHTHKTVIPSAPQNCLSGENLFM